MSCRSSPRGPLTLGDLRTEIESLIKSINWSQESFNPLLEVVGKRLARIFNNLLKMMEPLIKFGGGEQVRSLI